MNLNMISMRALIALFILLISSCTVTRRVHRPGFDIQWKDHYSVQEQPEEKIRPEEEFTAGSEISMERTEPVIQTSDLPEMDGVHVSGTEDSGTQSSYNWDNVEDEARELVKTTLKKVPVIHRTINTVQKFRTQKMQMMSTSANQNYTSLGILMIVFALLVGLVAYLTFKTSIAMITVSIALFGVPLAIYAAIRYFNRAKEYKSTDVKTKATESEQAKVVPSKPVPEKEKAPIQEKVVVKTETPEPKPQPVDTEEQADKLAIASFIIFLIGIVLFMVPFFPILFLPLSFILAISSMMRNKRRETPLKYRRLALVPVIAVSIIVVIVILAALLIAMIGF